MGYSLSFVAGQVRLAGYLFNFPSYRERVSRKPMTDFGGISQLY